MGNDAMKQNASFRDPSGFLFMEKGTLYRQVNLEYQLHYEKLMGSGLSQCLIDRKLLIPHEEVSIIAPEKSLAFKVIKPVRLPFVSYPYELSFSQYKDAALATLEIEMLALEMGMTLKDASVYNIQFLEGHPLLIDTLSFEIYKEGSPWVAYRQFCQHFLAPLSLMAHTDIRLQQLMRVYIDGIPLDLVSSLLPGKTHFNMGLELHIHRHAASQKKYAGKSDDAKIKEAKVNKISFQGLIDNLQETIKGLRWKGVGTEWANYYDITNYTPEAFGHKRMLVGQFIDEANPETVWDLGANNGEFSRIASTKGIFTVSSDIDPVAVEKNYKQSVKGNEKNLLPLLIDLTNPSPGIGWENSERASFIERGPVDLVMALALIHHLAISNNLPFDHIADFFAKLGEWLIIEFVPKEDSQVQRLLSIRKDIFPEYLEAGFDVSFQRIFKLKRKETIQGTKRTIYLFKRK
jgi:hypothetical protein